MSFERHWATSMTDPVCRQLSIHSLVDGRAFGACNVADGVPSASRRGALCFEGFEVLSLADVSPSFSILDGAHNDDSL